ncbi:hypothetical protein GGX14DRAFT_661542 [Mycena pura]|uniref:DUF6534 domain-containing protein n=1 Tax=Mycena pura TaxID=153505 RepID=A0AAD6YAQ2_9AGAR|nr:hypothetical protein GGX14DRAFT_661542 [Mycena pura]
MSSPAFNYAPLVSSTLIGSLLNFLFFGTLLVQVYVYRLCFPKDHPFVKSLVYFIFLGMLVCTCLIARDAEYRYATAFGDIARWSYTLNSPIYTPILGSFIVMLAQGFFCCRIVVIKRAAWPLAVVIGLISMTQCGCGMGAGIVSYMKSDELHQHVRPVLVKAWLGGAALADILIAVSMTTLLLTAAVVPSTRGVVKSVVRLIIETNILSSVVTLLGLLLLVCIPNTTYYIGAVMVMPGIYANTMLVTLNNRAIARFEAGDGDGDGDALGSFVGSFALPRSSTADASSKEQLAAGGVPGEPMAFARRQDADADEDDLPCLRAGKRGSVYEIEHESQVDARV